MDKSITSRLAGAGALGKIPRNICFVIADLLGATEVSEKGAPALALAQSAAFAGFNVTIAWIPPRGVLDPEEDQKLTQYYLNRYMITVDIIQEAPELSPGLRGPGKRSYAIFSYLKENDYDEVIFAAEEGLGYYALLAKETDVFPNPPRLTVLASAPIAWRAEVDRFFLGNTEEVSIAHMERYCAGACDSLVCVSQSLLDWMVSAGWEISGNAAVITPPRPQEWCLPQEVTDLATSAGPRTEIAFVGDHSLRAGIGLFCDSLDALAGNPAARDLKVTLLGPFGRVLGEHSGGLLLRRARRWPFKINIVPRATFEETLLYLRERRCLAVLPSLSASYPLWLDACLQSGIAVVATDTPGIRQHIHGDDCATALAEPKPAPLAARIAEWLTRTGPVARPIRTDLERHEEWRNRLDHSSAIVSRPRRAGAATEDAQDLPLVSIVLPHHDRPDSLVQAVRSVVEQDYPRIELILVDDGSKNAASHQLLDRLEPEFKERGWKILREPNRHLGAARNTAIRVAKGDRILFLDDDNALFPNAVRSFVRAMDASGADICTNIPRIFHGTYVPSDERMGLIHYFPLGGSLDLGVVFNSYGDAGAMFRREVFDDVGMLIEDYGYTAHDWELFVRAAFAGKKIRIIPEPLYWYRSSADGMYRSSNWYSNRIPILDVFKKGDISKLEHLVHMLLAKSVDPSEIEGYRENLNYNPSDVKLSRLSSLEPNSPEALDLLAEISAAEGHEGAALAILGATSEDDFSTRALQHLSTRSDAEQALADLESGFKAEKKLGEADLRQFMLESDEGGEPLFYVEGGDRLYVESRRGIAAIAVLPGGCPTGTTKVRAMVGLDQPDAVPSECLVMIAPPDVDPRIAISQSDGKATEGSSGWCPVSNSFMERRIEAQILIPRPHTQNLIIAVRPQAVAPASTLVRISGLTVEQSLGRRSMRRPRIGPPPTRMRTRDLTDAEIRNIGLVTSHESPLPMLLLPREGGIFLRPSSDGPVVAQLPRAFPPFARRVIAQVEIANEEASPFEFAMAITKPSETAVWEDGPPAGCLAFSGWMRVNERLRLHELRLEMDQPMKTALAINLAIRLPPGSRPSPAEAYWRRLIIGWGD